MTSAQDVGTSVISNSPSQDSFHPGDQIPSKYVTPGFKSFSTPKYICKQMYTWKGENFDKGQKPTSRSMQLHYIPVTAFS